MQSTDVKIKKKNKKRTRGSLLETVVGTNSKSGLAQANLGHTHINGLGVDRNIVTALFWYKESERQGFVLSNDLSDYLNEISRLNE